VIDELASLQRLPQLHTAITENRKSQNPVILGFQGRSQMEARYGEDSEAMLSQPATKIFLRTQEPRAAKWVSEAIGDVEIERLRETHYDGSRAGKNFTLDRQTEPLVLPPKSPASTICGDFSYGNHVARFSFFIALQEKSPGFDERTMDDLIVPSTPQPVEPSRFRDNSRSPKCKFRSWARNAVDAHAHYLQAALRRAGTKATMPREFTAKEQNYWSERGVIAGDGKAGLRRNLALPEQFPLRTLRNLAKASIRQPASSLSASVPLMNIRMLTAGR